MGRIAWSAVGVTLAQAFLSRTPFGLGMVLGAWTVVATCAIVEWWRGRYGLSEDEADRLLELERMMGQKPPSVSGGEVNYGPK